MTLYSGRLLIEIAKYYPILTLNQVSNALQQHVKCLGMSLFPQEVDPKDTGFLFSEGVPKLAINVPSLQGEIAIDSGPLVFPQQDNVVRYPQLIGHVAVGWRKGVSNLFTFFLALHLC